MSLSRCCVKRQLQFVFTLYLFLIYREEKGVILFGVGRNECTQIFFYKILWIR